ncbi:MAG: endolytic transglycosylase MltG [Candidatus Limnocylindrales bacterium]
MTIRSGGRPRDPRDARAPHARPYQPDAYATESVPESYEPVRRGSGRNGGYRGGGGGGNGLMGIVKFLVFALILAGIVLALALTALRPFVNSVVLGWAADNPAALNFPFVAEIVREDLGAALTNPASDDPEQVDFVVNEGDTASTIAARLEEEGLITDARAFVFIASERALAGALQKGDFILRRNLTPDEVVTALLAPPEDPFVEIALRTGLRLEQITAKLQTLTALTMDPREFYELATDPPASLLADYPWLRTALDGAPAGASLEGFLWPAAYRVLPDTTPDELIRLMLDGFIEAVGQERLTVPAERGLTFYEVLTLASIVEREAVLDEERPIIAGVYQNRLLGVPGVKNKILNADPTVIYAADTVNLDAAEFDTWQQYVFWTVPEAPLRDVVLPESLAGYNSYLLPGLPPGPIATPTVASLDAALTPDTTETYIYFLAIPEGGGAHVFARTKKEHDANRKQYGYID